MAMTKLVLLALLLIYMTGVSAMIAGIGQSVNTENHKIDGLGYTFGFNLITGWNILPDWFAMILLTIPSVIIILIVLTFFIPALNIW